MAASQSLGDLQAHRRTKNVGVFRYVLGTRARSPVSKHHDILILKDLGDSFTQFQITEPINQFSPPRLC